MADLVTPWMLRVMCGCIGITFGVFATEGRCGTPSARLMVTAKPAEMRQEKSGRIPRTLPIGRLLVLIEYKEFTADSPLGREQAKVRVLSEPKTSAGWVNIEDLCSIEAASLSQKEINERTAANAKPLPEVIRVQSPAVVRAWQEVQAAIAENERLPQPLAEPFFARAEILSIAKDFDSALRDYLRAIKLANQSKDDPTAYLAYFERLREALEDYDRMPRPPASGNAASHYSAGVHSYRSGDLEAALRHFSNAIAVEGDVSLYWYFRALTYKRMNQETRAQHDALIGSHLEWKNGVSDRLGLAFIFVQGERRDWLERYRLGDPTQQKLR